MKPFDKLAAIQEVQALFREVRETLKIDREQSISGVMFDVMVAVDKATHLLDKAWKITSLYNLSDEGMRQEFMEVLQHFQKIKKDIGREVKWKH